VNKRARYFEKIAEFLERFRDLPTETLRSRLATGTLQKEAVVALRELLEERQPQSHCDAV
jgi:hypothetical protein